MNNLGGDSMYKIGDFSKMSKVNIKALRYYEKEGLWSLFIYKKGTQDIMSANLYTGDLHLICEPSPLI